MSILKYYFIQACWLSWIVMPVAAAIAADAGGVNRPFVQVHKQHITVQAKNTPVEAILTEIAQQSGIEIYFQGRCDNTVTLDLQHVSLEMGIKHLVNGHNHAFTYGYDESSVITIKQLYIYSKTGRGDMKCITLANAARPLQPVKAPLDNGIVIHQQTPTDGDPLVSMQAIDPLMKINGAQAPHLPAGFHIDGNSQDGDRWEQSSHIDAGALTGDRH